MMDAVQVIMRVEKPQEAGRVPEGKEISCKVVRQALLEGEQAACSIPRARYLERKGVLTRKN